MTRRRTPVSAWLSGWAFDPINIRESDRSRATSAASRSLNPKGRSAAVSTAHHRVEAPKRAIASLSPR